MSLLADLLAKNKSDEPHGDKEIPPTLSQSYAFSPTSDPERSMKSRYTFISLVLVALVALGAVATIQFDRLMLLVKPKSAVVSTAQLSQQPKPIAPVVTPPVQVTDAIAEKKVDEIIPDKKGEITNDETVLKPPKSVRKNMSRSKKRVIHRTSSLHPVVPAVRTAPQKMDITVAPRPGSFPLAPAEAVKRDALLYAARSAEMMLDWRMALLKYRSALEIDPENFQIMNNIAASLNNLGRFGEGALEAKRALAKKPLYVPAMINAAIAYSSSGNSMEALLLFTDALNADPGNKNLTINLGVLQERTGKLDEAQVTYRQLADAGEPHAMAGMGRIYERKGYRNEAAKIYRKVLKMPEAGSVLKKELRERLTRLEE